MNTTTLTSQARSALRAAAHPLRPVVLIGDQGLSEPVLKEIDLALNAHELIKIRAAGQERDEREQILARICEQLGCEPVHHLGKTLIVYRLGKAGRFAAQTGQILPTRKPDGPHTPKKLAALGKTVKKSSQNRKRPEKAEPVEDFRVFSSERPPRPSSRPARTVRKTAAKTIRKSALSLKAGARRR